jgi:hypothetical protein
MRAQLLAIVAGSPEPITRMAIFRRAHGGRGLVVEAWGTLVAEGRVICVSGRRVRADPRRYRAATGPDASRQ